MRWLIESVMVFFGTLIAAALVALGAPGFAELAVVEAVQRSSHAGAVRDAATGLLERVSSVAGSMGSR